LLLLLKLASAAFTTPQMVLKFRARLAGQSVIQKQGNFAAPLVTTIHTIDTPAASVGFRQGFAENIPGFCPAPPFPC
jgi:hypothetical protein